MKAKVLFVCSHNSARSQMAEAWLNTLCGDHFSAKSAGFEPGVLNPLVVEAMGEVGIDISQNTTKSVFELFKTGGFFGFVIGVCDQSVMEKCPVFPAPVKRLNWSFADPANFSGTNEEKLEQVRELRDKIRSRVEEWCEQMCKQPAGDSPKGFNMER